MFIKKLLAGDSVNLLDSWPMYPATDGWLFKTRLTPLATGGAAITWQATAEGDDYRTVITSAQSGNWVAGYYNIAQWVERGDERVTLYMGGIEIVANPLTALAGTDGRSHLAKTVAMIEKMLEGKAGKDVQEYTIGDRQLKHIPLTELLVWRDKYRAQLAAENAANGVNKGIGLGRKIWVRVQ